MKIEQINIATVEVFDKPLLDVKHPDGLRALAYQVCNENALILTVIKGLECSIAKWTPDTLEVTQDEMVRALQVVSMPFLSKDWTVPTTH